jgi:diguanylate cyclase (GGDEF)-like protein
VTRNPDLVRRAAIALSSDRPMAELYDELAVLLAVYVDASMMLVFVSDRDALECVYANLLGRSGAPDDRAVSRESTASAVFESGEPVRYDSADDWPYQRLHTVRGRRMQPQAAIFVPIEFGGRRLGVLSVQSSRPNAYAEGDVAALETCALYLGARIRDEQQRLTVERFERLATVDVLTGVANRNALDQALEREWSRARRNGTSIAMLMIDVDFFKAFNDTYGHVAGDGTLQKVASAAAACTTRSGDLLARYGGEEFAVVLPETSVDGAVTLAETIRGVVECLEIPHDGSSLGRVSISIGCAAFTPSHDEGAVALVRAADAALYEAKLQGRNRVAAPGYRGSVGTPIERRSRLRGNLPEPRTRFFGRASDVERLVVALDAHRVVTIVGPGGVGKTRVALEVAGTVAPGFADGAWFVDLIGLSDPAEIVAYVATSLQSLLPPRRYVEDLIGALRERRLLIVLDNCEHVVDAAAALVDRLSTELPELRVLATTREPLSVEGEFVYRLGSLDEREGIALFRDRALSAGVAASELHEPAIAAVVAQLDGIPLAIELAAPRLTIVSLDDLRERLGDRLTSLRSSSRRQPTRQQTLHALMDWSYRLLSPGEQNVFRRLSVFVGGWTTDAAASVCADETLSESSVAAAIESLVAKSLVIADEDEQGRRRFRMLETTREYAAEQLEAAGDGEGTIARHAQVFAAIALEYGAERSRTATTVWQRRVTGERGNFEAALRTLLEGRVYELAAQMIVALCDWLWERGGLFAFDAVALSTALEADGEALEPSLRAALQLALACARRRTDPQGYFECALPAYEHYRASGPVRLAAAALRGLTNATLIRTGGLSADLEEPLIELADAMEERGDEAIAAELVNLLGTFYTQTMDDALLPLALKCFDRGIALYEARGDADCSGIMFGNSSDVAFYMGDIDEALRRVRRSIGLLEQSEEPWQAAIEYLNLGHFATWAGDFETAREALRKAFDGTQAFYGRYGVCTVFDKVARLAFACGERERAARLLGYADIAYVRDASARQRREKKLIDDMRVELQEALGPERFAAESAIGHAYTPSQAQAELDAVLDVPASGV